METNTKLGTRAVELLVRAGLIAWCSPDKGCDRPIKFHALERRSYVVCNVYEEERWKKTETFHSACYDAAGHPWGEPDRTNATTLKGRHTLGRGTDGPER
jgi:hypothetical protein